MSSSKYLLIPILFSILLIPNVSSQTQINGQDCPDKCEDGTLYFDGRWDARMRICIYATEKPCKYGCERLECKPYPDTLPIDEQEARDVIFDIVKTTYEKEERQAYVNVMGTEYQPGDNGTVFVQLLDDDKKAINDGLCFLDIYKPDKTIYVDNGTMMWLNGSDGLYYYDLIIPNDLGVYMMSAYCNFYNNLTFFPIIQDAYVDKTHPNINYGSAPFLAIGNFTTYNSFIQFGDININNLETITLYLYVFYTEGSTGTIQRLNQSWNESTITWNNKPTHEPYYYENINITTIGWHGFDITDLVKEWNNGTHTNYGLLLNCSVWATNITAFYSTNQGNAYVPGVIAIYHTTDQLTEIKGSGELHVTDLTNDIAEEVYLTLSTYPEPILLSNHDYCLDNNTLIKELTYEICVGSDCKFMSRNETQPCNYGCSNNMCIPPPWLVILIAIIVASAIAFVIWVMMRYRE